MLTILCARSLCMPCAIPFLLKMSVDAHFLKGRENVSNAVKLTEVGVICYLFDIYDITAIRNK